jgi:phosphoribulokinase
MHSTSSESRAGPSVEAAQAEAGAGRVLPFVLGIIGDSGSGKSMISNAVRHLLGDDKVADLKLDDYLRFTRAERRERGLTSLDPKVHDFELMHAHLRLLRAGRSVRVRSYEHADGTFGGTRTIVPREVVLVRGLLGFPSDELRQA